MQNNKKGYLISFEGIDGSGKSTLIINLKKYFEKNLKNKFIYTREPGGTKEAEIIRNVLLDAKNDISYENKTEILLLLASRYEHYTKLIKPALKEGKIVICDRFIDSTIAYQCNNNDSLKQFFLNVSSFLIKNFTPDLTILLDIKAEQALARIKKRNKNNRYDKRKLDFYKKVRQEYLAQEKKFSRISLVDASKNADLISKQVIEIILNKIS